VNVIYFNEADEFLFEFY